MVGMKPVKDSFLSVELWFGRLNGSNTNTNIKSITNEALDKRVKVGTCVLFVVLKLGITGYNDYWRGKTEQTFHTPKSRHKI